MDNPSAFISYATAKSLIADRIKEWLDDYKDLPEDEPSVMGFVVALRVLAQAHPASAALGLRVSEVEQWRDRYLEWFEKYRGKVKVSRGVSKDEIAVLARKEFDAIIRALKKG